jgi:hypothetical protein
MVVAQPRHSSECQDRCGECSWSEFLICCLAIYECTFFSGITAPSANWTTLAFNCRRGYFSHDRVGNSQDVAHSRNSWSHVVVGVVRLPNSHFDVYCISNWQPFRIPMALPQRSLLSVLYHRSSGYVRVLPSSFDYHGNRAIDVMTRPQHKPSNTNLSLAYGNPHLRPHYPVPRS